MDILSEHERSRRMALVRSKGTRPELAVANLLSKLRFKCSTQEDCLAGKPDFVHLRRRRFIFVHGCFWNRHACRRATTPASNRSYWLPKFARNKRRDRENHMTLQKLGWKILVVWECECGDTEKLKAKVK